LAVGEGKSIMTGDLFNIRSVLFLPASNPRAIAKARIAGADLLLVELVVGF
jgi:citrate lyase subunit beta/citryl-CoA lyase